MRLLTTNLTFKEVQPKLKELVDTLFKIVPAGVGAKGFVKVNKEQFKEIVEQGSKWCVENDYGWKEDLERTEGYGKIDWADASKVSEKAISRGINQMGTLGSGNHYLEIQKVEEHNIVDKELAKKFGIFSDQIVIMVHCLPGDAKVMTEYGAWIRIKDLENKNIRVKCFDERSHQILDTEVEKFYKIKHKERMFKLMTKSGKEIIITEDHPILTKNGLKFIKEIKIDEKVAIMPFEGVEYEEPANNIIVDEKSIRNIYDSDIIVNELKSKGLLPLRLNSKQLPILAKLAGYITGDGTIRKSGRGFRSYILGMPIDLKEIGQDIKKLGFNVSKIYGRKTRGVIHTTTGEKLIEGESFNIECSRSAFCILMAALSVPIGKKTHVEFEVPKWLFRAPGWIKKLYLGGYFGAELTHPIILKDNKHFERLSLAVYKAEHLKENGMVFLSQIKSMLENFGINSVIFEEKDSGRLTKNGKTLKLVIRVSGEMLNLTNFWSKINYEYCNRKSIESSLALQYLGHKQNILSLNAEKLNVGINSIKFKPYQYGVISSPKISNFIVDHRLNPPTPVVWDVVERIEKITNKEKFVYDIKVKNNNHNFIADNFIVGNCGSRGFGHQLASDYLQIFDKIMPKYNIKIRDRELSCAPFNSKEGQDYYRAMACAANMAFVNRQVILHRVREGFSKVFKKSAEELEMNLVYDVAHNIAKLEEHKVDGKKKKLIVHRKGATRAFPPGHEELSKLYKDIGQPVIIGGSMETGSFLLVGTQKAMDETFGTTCHGSGRTMSRTQARHEVRGDKLLQDMSKKGIYVRSVSMSGLAEEAGVAYKDINEVVKTVELAGISKPVVGLRPLGNVKG